MNQPQAISVRPVRCAANVCHVVESIDPQYGGPSFVAVALAAAQRSHVQNVQVITQLEPGRSAVVKQFVVDEIGADNQWIKLLPVSGKFERQMSPRIAALLFSRLPNNALLHLHGLWTSGNVWSYLASRRRATPYVLRPAGCLEPWGLTQSAARKKVAMDLLFRRILNAAGAIHATSDQEADNIRKVGVTAPIAVIPNGVKIFDLDRADCVAKVEARWPTIAGRRRLLFLSRIHKKKGLLLLAEAWRTLRERWSDWHVVIAGPDEDGYQQTVADAFASFDGLRDVTFTGPVNGLLKHQLYRASDVFVLPTYSENFGVVIAEALAARTPVVTTTGTPWSSLKQRDCGWHIEPNPQELTQTLDHAFSLPEKQRLEMGLRGRKLIEDEFSWPAIASKTVAMYAWLNGERDRPEFVSCGDAA